VQFRIFKLSCVKNALVYTTGFYLQCKDACPQVERSLKSCQYTAHGRSNIGSAMRTCTSTVYPTSTWKAKRNRSLRAGAVVAAGGAKPITVPMTGAFPAGLDGWMGWREDDLSGLPPLPPRPPGCLRLSLGIMATVLQAGVAKYVTPSSRCGTMSTCASSNRKF